MSPQQQQPPSMTHVLLVFGLVLAVAIAVAITVPIAWRAATRRGTNEEAETTGKNCGYRTGKTESDETLSGLFKKGTPQRRADIGCPVLFTDANDYRGASACFQIGQYPDLDVASTSGASTSGASTSGASTSGASTSGASTSGASTSAFLDGVIGSYEVRPGYTLVAYSEPGFRGDVLLSRRGHAMSTFRSVAGAPPLPKSMIVRLDMTSRVGGETLKRDVISA